MKSPGIATVVSILLLILVSYASDPTATQVPATLTRSPVPIATSTPTPTPTPSPVPTVTPAPTPFRPSTLTPPGLQADVIFFNGHIITMEPDMPSAEAVAVLGTKLLRVGTDEETLVFAGPETQMIDLGGRALLPGFVDPHTHPLDYDSADSLEETQQYILEGGTTTIGDTSAPPDKLARVLQVLESTSLRIRTSLYLPYNSKCRGIQPEDWILEHPPIRDPTAMFRIPGIKIFGDPAGPSTRCGWAPMSVLLPPEFAEERAAGPYGDLLLSAEEMAQVIAKYQALGYQVVIHARGDVTAETVLDAIEAALAGQPNTFRHRIEHNDYIRPDLLPRYGEVGALPTIRGRPAACGFNDSGGVHPFGEEVQPWFRVGQSLLDANPGLPVAWHSDVVSFARRPIHDLYDLVTRKAISRADGSVCEPPDWLNAKVVSLKDALRMMAINGAYALFMEEKVGSLKPGKFADLIVMSDNPLAVDPDALIDPQVLMTMVGGRVEYCGQEDLCPTGISTATPTPRPTPTLPIPTSQMDIPYGPHERQKLDVFTRGDFMDAPIIVLVHGGGWWAGNKTSQHQYVDFYNELGFVVVTPNYRLVTENGLNTFPTPINDVGCSVAWIKSNATKYGADGSTMFISGNSAGAHIAAMLAYNTERNWLEECGI